MSYPKDELAVPDAVHEDPRSFEIARLWIADGRQVILLRADVWPDPAAWGLMLADMARHLANAYHDAHGMDPAAALRRMLAGLQAELDQPTDEVEGGFPE
jgi:hypothetical protein